MTDTTTPFYRFIRLAQFDTHVAAEFRDRQGETARFDEPSLRARIANGAKYGFNVYQEKIGLAAIVKSRGESHE